MKIYESGENYLEAILILSTEKGYVRSIDVAQKMNFSKPSISRAISVLKSNSLIFVDCLFFNWIFYVFGGVWRGCKEGCLQGWTCNE